MQPFESVPVTTYKVLAVGATISTAKEPPVLQRYDAAPDAVRVSATPAHNTVEDALMKTCGKAFTLTTTVSTLEQPLMSVPETVYAVVTDGITTSDCAVPPVLHAYVSAPLAVKVSLVAKQMFPDVALAVTTGRLFTGKVNVSELTQPLASVPVTVYVVVAPGVSVTLEPTRLPGCQL